jgi:flagellar protein FlgJ
MNTSSPVTHTALDFNGLAELRRSSNATENDPETMRQVAGQFEALFINMMLQSMRKASLAEGVFDSSQSNMYRDMSDQQMAMDLSKRGGLGLQEVIIRQLGGQLAEKLEAGTSLKRDQAFSIDTVSRRSALPNIETPAVIRQIEEIAVEVGEIATTGSVDASEFKTPQGFVKQLWSLAEQAAEKIGVKPEAILSQAALETGWGKHILAKPNGESSYNLFNIKAHSAWSGDTVAIGTLEYRNGVAVKEQAKFRAYDSYQASFNDYIAFLQTQPRYRQALEDASDPELFIEGLHKAGYATDPAYADKIKRIMNSDTLAQISSPLDIASNVAENMTTGMRS